MNEQTRATTLAAGAPAATAPEDAWDRLAALAFGDAASEGGCSEHAFDCTCLAAHGAAEAIAPAVAASADSSDSSADSGDSADFADSADSGGLVASVDSGGEPPVPDPDRPIDPEADPTYPAPESVPDPDRPVFPEPEPEPTPPLTPDPGAEPGSQEQRSAEFTAKS
jgi:hypothetical protein